MSPTWGVAGHPAQDIPVPGGQFPRAGMSGSIPPVLDPMFQQQRLNLGLPPSSTYSLQSFIQQQQQQRQQQQQQQQQLYMHHSLPQMHPPMAGRPNYPGHALGPSFADIGPYGPAATSPGYPNMASTSPLGQMPEFNANPGAGLAYGAYPGMRPMFPSFSGAQPGQDAAWNAGLMSRPSAQNASLREQRQQQQQQQTQVLHPKHVPC